MPEIRKPLTIQIDPIEFMYKCSIPELFEMRDKISKIIKEKKMKEKIIARKWLKTMKEATNA